MIDDLAYFEFKEFDEDVLATMKREIPELLKLVDEMKYDFEGKEAAKEGRLYEERLKSRARRSRQLGTLRNIDDYIRKMEEEGGDEYDFQSAFGSIEEVVKGAGENDSGIGESFTSSDWKQDVGERSRRIYEWWRTVMNERRCDGIRCFVEAVKLVAVCQVSSASVERVFGQLTFIRRAVGDGKLRQMMELRAFIRCNNGLEDDFTINGD